GDGAPRARRRRRAGGRPGPPRARLRRQALRPRTAARGDRARAGPRRRGRCRRRGRKRRAPRAPGGAGMRTILVVDDEQDVVEMMRLLLGRKGYQVISATSAMDGLTQGQSALPDLILLDIMMHQMDGWEVLKLLKLDERTQGIPVVILSARVEPRDKIRGLQEGAIDYVTKPFAMRDLIGKIAA